MRNHVFDSTTVVCTLHPDKKCHFDRGCLLLMHPFGAYIASRNYSVVQCETYFIVLDHLGLNHQCDGQTEL